MLKSSIIFILQHIIWRIRKIPVDMQPFVVSPRAWTWNPWRPGVRPVMVPVTVVGPDKVHNQLCIIDNILQGYIYINNYNLISQTELKITISFLSEVDSSTNTRAAVQDDNCLSHFMCFLGKEKTLHPSECNDSTNLHRNQKPFHLIYTN